MPAVSDKQFRFMKHLQSDKSDRLKVGMTEEQVKHFTETRPRKKSIFDKGKDFISGKYGASQEKKRLRPPNQITGVRG